MARDHTFLAMVLSRNDSDEIFIDQDGDLFRHIMFWYRFGLLPDYVAVGVPFEIWDAYVDYFADDGSGDDEDALKIEKFSKVLDWMISSMQNTWKTNLKAQGSFCFGHETGRKERNGIPAEVFETTPEIFNDNINLWISLAREKGIEMKLDYKGSYSIPHLPPASFFGSSGYKMYMYVIITKKGMSEEIRANRGGRRILSGLNKTVTGPH